MRNLKYKGVVLIILMLSLTSVSHSQTTDYSNSAHWLHVPASNSQPVDVFYLYPTAWIPSSPDEISCAVDNASMLAQAPLAYAKSATAFENFTNIYAPYYRQLNATLALTLPEDQAERLMRDIPTADAVAAFKYYIENYNNGRPFILAGHSQGSNTLLYFLDDYLKSNPDILQRMVAGYLIGYSVTQDYLNSNAHLRFGIGPADTGVILSWNTELPGATGNNPVLLPGAMLINPLIWTQDEVPAGVQYNLGTLFLDANGQAQRDANGNIMIVEGVADALVNAGRGVVVCYSVDPASVNHLPYPFNYESLHGYDYAFYFRNIQLNALLRASVFLSRNQATMYPAAMRAGADVVRAFAGKLPSFSATYNQASTQSALVTSPGSELPAMSEENNGLTAFAVPFGLWTDQESNDGYSGYDFRATGVAAGIYKSIENFRFGVAFGFNSQRQSMKDYNAEINGEVLHTAFFAGVKHEGFFVDASVGYSYASNRSERNIDYPGFANWKHSADFQQNIWSGRLHAGHIWEFDHGLRIIPSLGLDNVHVRNSSFQEDGAESALDMEASSYNSLQLPVSLLIDMSFDLESGALIRPYVEFAWIPEIGENNAWSSGSFALHPSAGTFRADSAAPGYSRGRFSTGILAELASSFALAADYSFGLASDYQSHDFAVSLLFKF